MGKRCSKERCGREAAWSVKKGWFGRTYLCVECQFVAAGLLAMAGRSLQVKPLS